MQKNIAGQKIKVFAYDKTTNDPLAGDAANITCTIEKDGGALVATIDVNPTDRGGGYYEFDAAQAESNANVIDVYPVSSTADIIVLGCPSQIVTTPPNYAAMGIETDGDLTKVNLCAANIDMVGTNGASTSGELAAAKTEIDAIRAQTDKQVYTVANQLDVNVKSIDDNSAVVATLKTIFGSSIQIGIVGAGISTDVLIASSDVTGPLDGALTKSVLQFITGNNAGRKALISGNTQATGIINLEVGFELLTAPIVGDIFIIP